MKKIYKMFGFILLLSSAFFLFSCNKNTSNNNNDSNETQTDTKYSITINNQLNNITLTVNIKETEESDSEAVTSGEKYLKDSILEIYAQNTGVIDTMLEVVSNKAIVKRCKTEAASDTIGYITIKLTGNTEIKLYNAADVAGGALIINEDKSANTTEAQNVCHVYDPEDADLADYANGKEIAFGKKVKIFEFNYATRVHFEIKHNGVQIVSKDYDMITDENWQTGHEEYFEFTVEGDIEIIITNIE